MNTIPTKPGLYTTIAVITLISGVLNLMWGFVASATALGTLVGIVCLPVTILPTILGIFEIIHAARMMSVQPQGVKPLPVLAGLEISTLLLGNVFSTVAGILVLVFYNDLAVRDYFAQINGAPAPVQPAGPPQEPPSDPQVRKLAGE